MHISALSLTNFRSYPQLDLELEPTTNVFVGFNGVGKTNILEAIYYLAVHQSHRVAHDAPLIRFGTDQARIRARIHHGDRAIATDLEINPGKANRIAINRGAPQPAREGLGLVRAVIFSPEDLHLVTGEPGGRRRFLDELVVQLRPVMADATRDYDKVLRQRNALYKSARKTFKWGPDEDATRDVFDEYLARAGARILNGRLHVLQMLAQPLAQHYARLTPNGTKSAGYSYESTVPLAAGQHAEVPSEEELYQAMLEQIRAHHDQERERGVTLIGPHRDDVVLQLGPAPAKGFASHGETWSFALALKLGSYQILVDDHPDPDARPILLLDDVFAELDANRRRQLAEMIEELGDPQVIVTAAVAEDLPETLRGQQLRIHMDTDGNSGLISND